MQENFASVYKEATEAIQSENYERSAVRLLYIFYEAYFYNDVQNDINAIIAKALKKAGNQSVEKASEILYDAMDKIMEGDLDDDDEMDFTAGMEQMQQAIGAMGESVAQAQQKMAEAMMSGNMEEYSRLVLEMQKKIMGNFMN